MRTPLELANAYMHVWNERDAGRRSRSLGEGWTEAATYVDPLADVAGIPAIAALIGTVQERFPDFRFTLSGTPNGFGAFVRFSWDLGPLGGPAVVKGTDIVRRDGDRIASVIGFIDQMPA